MASQRSEIARGKDRVTGRVRRAAVHLRRGTLPARLAQEWRKIEAKLRGVIWDVLSSRKERIEMILCDGVSLVLYSDSKLSRLIYADKFEERERSFLNAFLREGDVFIDAGANIGLLTLIGAWNVGRSGEVFAFEPCSRTFERLTQNVAINDMPQITCLRLALSDFEGQAEMTVTTDGYDAWNSLGRPAKGASFDVETVQATTLDHFLLERNGSKPIALIKIDVEGWETRVLAGARRLLAGENAPVLMVEFTDDAATGAGSSCASLYNQLEELGYRMFTFDPASMTLNDEPPRDKYPYLNLIAAKHPQRVIDRLRNHIGDDV